MNSFLYSVGSNSLRPRGLQLTRLLCPWDFSGKNTKESCRFLLQAMFPTQGLNPLLMHFLPWQADSLPLQHLGSRSSFPPIHKLWSLSKFPTSEFFFFPWKHLPSALLPPSVITLLLGFLLWSSPFLQFLVLSDLLTSCRLVPVWARHRKFITNILHDWIQWWFLRLHCLAPAAFHSGVTLVISARTLEVSTLHCSLFLGHSGLLWLSKIITTSKSFILDFSGGPVVKTSSFQCWGCQVVPWSWN